MAKGPQEDEPRRSPLLAQIILIVLFALLVVASVFTVIVPELLDDSNEDEPTRPAPAAQP
jgi:hypothetical protein